jgi:hypothetical protein
MAKWMIFVVLKISAFMYFCVDIIIEERQSIFSKFKFIKMIFFCLHKSSMVYLFIFSSFIEKYFTASMILSKFTVDSQVF